MGDQYGQRQLRNIGVDALTGNVPTNAVVSDDQRQYTDQVARLQREATSDPVLNGQDATQRRLTEHGG